LQSEVGGNQTILEREETRGRKERGNEAAERGRRRSSKFLMGLLSRALPQRKIEFEFRKRDFCDLKSTGREELGEKVSMEMG